MSVLFFKNNYFPKVKMEPSFEHEHHFRHKNGVAFQTKKAYFASGLNEGGTIHCTFIPNKSFSTLEDWIAKSFGDTKPIKADYVPGTFYKRIWRPLACSGNFRNAISQEKLNDSFVSLRILLNKLEKLFETVEPSNANLKTYGHKIREVILLACMEVESSWSAVLKENEYCLNKQYTTNDYVKLKNPMLLDGYELSLQSYPNLGSFVPFKDWDASNPTGTLSWYDAYNKTKHDREENLKLATLENAIKSVGAAVVMFHAQFGFRFNPYSDQKTPVITNIFHIVTSGFKKYEKGYYIPKIDVNERDQLDYSWDWTGVNYPF